MLREKSAKKLSVQFVRETLVDTGGGTDFIQMFLCAWLSAYIFYNLFAVMITAGNEVLKMTYRSTDTVVQSGLAIKGMHLCKCFL